MTLFETMDHPLLDKIREVNLDDTTPLEALQLMKEWQEELYEKQVASRPK